MDYIATEMVGFTFNQLQKFTQEDIKLYERYKYNYPLIFVKDETSIIFFNMLIPLDRVQYDFLYQLVKNATVKKDKKGLSALKLFNLLQCKHRREKSVNPLLDENDRADIRIRHIKSDIKKIILQTYKSKEKELAKTQNCIANPIGISLINNKQYFYDIEIENISPYYYFEINSAIKFLVINQNDKDKKYSTRFIFS